MTDDPSPPFVEDDPVLRITHGPVRPLPETSFAAIGDGAIDHAADDRRRDPQSDTLVWAPIGPRNVGGRLRALVQDPQTPRILYAGSGQGGIWKTENGGDTWRSLGTLLDRGKEVAAPIGAIGLCHRSPQHLYVGTGEPVDQFFAGYGLFYSSDSGQHFTRIAPPASGAAGQPIRADRFERILVDPWQPKRAWIAAPTGLWRSRPAANAADPPAFGAAADAIDAAPVAGNPQDITDIAIDFGNKTQAAPPATFTVIAAVRGQGVFRALFDTATGDYRVAAGVRWTRLGAAAAGAGFAALPTIAAAQRDNRRGRIKLALCEAQPAHIYFIMGQGRPNDGVPSRVFHSDNGGARWRQRVGGAGAPENASAIGYYALTLEVHPTNPAIVVAGSVQVSRSANSGQAWTRIMDPDAYDRGDRAQHADQHTILFDRADPSAIWVANDGGISLGRDQGGVTRWRKRSHGILAAQFFDVTVHPTFPFITGGGLLDNGTWVGFGGPSWYFINSGDGGAIGFEPNDPQRFLTTFNADQNSQFGVDRVAVDSPLAAVGGVNTKVNPIPDVDTPGIGIMRAGITSVVNNFVNADSAVFTARLEAVPGVANTWIVGRRNRAYLSRNGTTFNPLGTPAFTGVNPEVSAIAVAPSDAANRWWIGNDNGEIFATTNGGGAWTARHAAPIPVNQGIGDIAVHPQNPNIVAIAVDSAANPVFLSADGGAHWRDIANRASAGDGMPPSSATCIRFDPRGGTAVTDPQTLYVGTAAGVYVARGVVPQVPAGAPQPIWRTLNNGMPLVLVQDLAFVEFRNAAGAVTQRLLRAASYGRGVYELDLDATPAVRLLVRSTVIDDGRRHEGAAALAFDPRLRRAAAPRQVPLEFHHGFDLRVDAPVSFDVGQVMDGAEFDEQLRSGVLRRGDVNNVYVQVQNTGFRQVDGVRASLYFARLAAGGNAPDLDADFWATYPNPPEPSHVWQRAGEVTLNAVGPGQPQVARFVWNAPLDLPRDLALLALATHPDDVLGTPAPTLQVDPRPHGAGSLVRAERRAAMRVLRSQGGLFSRDAIDDTGEAGAVAWGARSLDIVVRQAAEANPDAAFAAQFDRRAADRLLPGAANHIFVRVTNRQAAAVQARVRLLRATFPDFARMTFPGVAPAPTAWQDIGTANLAVPANSSRFTSPGLVFNAPADVAPGSAYKSILLLALIGTDNDPPPDLAGVTDLAAFWRLVVANPDSNNVACRALRVGPAPGP